MELEKFNQSLGNILRDLRTADKLTQGNLARLTGLSRASIANMETGRQAMSAYQAFQIATALNLRSVEALYPVAMKDGDEEELVIYHNFDLSEDKRKQFKVFTT